MRLPCRLTELIERNYGAAGVRLHCLAQGAKSVYRVTRTNGPDWILRVYHQPDTGAEDDGPARDMATTLLFLEHQQYPTEYVIRAADSRQVIAHEGLRLLVTTYLGSPIHLWQPATKASATDASAFDYAPKVMRVFGETLGRLHTRRVDDAETRLPLAGMLPGPELAWASECLNRCAGQVPSRFEAEYHDLLEKVQGLDRCEGLPHCIIHNDCHFGNAILTSEGRVALVDWDGAGLGPAIVDVGFLLSSCFDKRGKRLHTEALAAVVEGYCRYHQLTEAELEHLSDAVRFRTLMILACCFPDRACATMHDKELIYGVSCVEWQAQYQASSEIVGLAQGGFRQHQQ